MLDPIATSRRVEEAYRRYLRSTLRPRDPDLLASFDRQLALAANRLGRGPILQAAAPYTTAASVADLVAEGVLSPTLLGVDPKILPPQRPLYAHQEAAIRRVVKGENAIVATGTGSGKTESFLLPIINSLLNEVTAGTLSQPGVRAMLLYPMNALANDQLKRLRQLLAQFPEITFGRYTGETDEKYSDALQLHRQLTGADPLPNELISREQVTEKPPHILITNFAMLEYLLLRPNDSGLFDGHQAGRWQFIVLDEVHVYDGTKGAEIAYLLRRLRDRVVRSERGKLTCIGTSATLGSGTESQQHVIDFAKNLFDEPFTLDSLVLPQRQALDNLSADWTITDAQIAGLLEALSNMPDDPATGAQHLAAAAEALQCPTVEPASDAATTLGRLLHRESAVVHQRRRLADGARDVRDVLSEFPDIDLVRLVELAWRAVDEDGNPVLPARYHMFLRSLEGAFVCVDPEHPTNDRLFLERHLHCPECERDGRRRILVEFGACRRCGAGYALGDRGHVDEHGNQRLAAATLHEQRLIHLLLDDIGNVDDEDDIVEDHDELEQTSEVLCTSCGAFGEPNSILHCCDKPTRIPVTLVLPSADGTVRRCGACRSHTNGNIVFRFLSGIDASGAVVASALYQELPPDDPAAGRPAPDDVSAGGRKLLTFSDSRQDAAYFANFLQRTHDRSIQRRVIWESLRRLAESTPRAVPQFDDLVPRTINIALECEMFPSKISVLGRAGLVKKWLFAELVSVDVAQGLEGVGLARISPAVPSGIQVPAGLRVEGLDDSTLIELTVALLNTLRTRNALRMPDEVSIDDRIFAPRHFTTFVRGQGPDRRVVAWSPGPKHRNGRLDLVERVFSRLGITQNSREFLANLWGWVSSPASPWRFVLPSSNEAALGVVHQLDPSQIAFTVADGEVQPRRCDTCRSITWFDLAGVCSKNGCTGTTSIAEVDNDDHYRHLYTQIEPVPARVEEHTAQLANKEAALRQAEFVRGAVNILSCSTTFELGVDVGEIQAVLMRNIPPGPANYVQRAGRAGRRSGSPALVVTMAQRRNHDLHYFAHPTAMIDGHVAPPVVKVDNTAIARRHLHSVALSAFLRYWLASDGNNPSTVGDFYETDPSRGTSVSEEWVRWLRTHPQALKDALSRLLPETVAQDLDVDHWGWVDALANAPVDGEGGWLFVAQNRARETISELEAEIAKMAEVRNFKAADQIGKVQQTIRRTRILNDLARKVIIPKYGFPVDTAPLDLSRAKNARAARLDLDRDLSMAIVEYAPGSQVVADKYMWESTGVVIPRGLELLTYSWRVCEQCESLTSVLSVLEPPSQCASCGSDQTSASGKYVWPQYGFIGEAVGEAGDQRPRRGGYAEMHFANYAHPPTEEQVLLNGRTVGVVASRHGEIQLINRGTKGFFALCRQCGRMEEAPARPKRGKNATPWKHQRPGSGATCLSTTFEAVALGHQYRTDVVEIRLDTTASTADYISALQAMLAALPDLGVKSGDVSGLTHVYDFKAPPGIVLVDAVPGGAGHTHMLTEHLQELFDLAWAKAATCTCSEDTSCYGCLRTYQNQRVHDVLTRDGALRVLSPYVSSKNALMARQTSS